MANVWSWFYKIQIALDGWVLTWITAVATPGEEITTDHGYKGWDLTDVILKLQSP